MISKVTITNTVTGRKEICTKDDVIGKRVFWRVLVIAPDGTRRHGTPRTMALQNKFVAECGRIKELKVEVEQ